MDFINSLTFRVLGGDRIALFLDFTAKETEMKKICAFFEQDSDPDTVDYYRLVGALYPANDMSKLVKEADQIENEVD